VLGSRVALRMGEVDYELMPLMVFLALLLIGGIVLIADAALRLFRGR